MTRRVWTLEVFVILVIVRPSELATSSAAPRCLSIQSGRADEVVGVSHDHPRAPHTGTPPADVRDSQGHWSCRRLDYRQEDFKGVCGNGV